MTSRKCCSPNERAGRSGSAKTVAITLAMAAAAVAALASGGVETTVWYGARTSAQTASACIRQVDGVPSRAGLTVVNRRGHICDVVGALTRRETGTAWTLRVGPKNACELVLTLNRRAVSVSDGTPACQPLWCGEGASIGTRKLARQTASVRLACEEP